MYLNTCFILLIFTEILKTAFINMIAILMMTAKLATPGLLKITVFWKKRYGITNSVHDKFAVGIVCDESLVT